MMPVHIVRPIGKHEFIPAYSTDELLRGVCHLTVVPDLAALRTAGLRGYQNEGGQKGIQTRQARSRAKFELNKRDIYAMLAEKRCFGSIARNFSIGTRQLRKYLKEEGR